MAIGKSLKKLAEKAFGIEITKKGEIEDKVSRKVTDAVAEERKWHETPSTDSPPQNDPYSEDTSYLYENADSIYHSKKKQTPMDRVIESFTGGWTNTTSILKASRYQSEGTLWNTQDASVVKYNSDPIAQSIINNLTYFTIGRGIKLYVDDPDVYDVIEKFRKDNDMVHREEQFVKMTFLDGENFLLFFVNRVTGDVKVRRIYPREIEDIEISKDDMETRLAYHQQWDETPRGTLQTIRYDRWIRDINYYKRLEEAPPQWKASHKSKKHGKLKEDVFIQFSKLGFDDEVRGRAPMAPVLRFLKYYEDWLLDRVRLNHERSKVVWIKSITGRSSEATKRERRSPKGGVMMVENDHVKYRIEHPRLDANDAKEDGLAILYAIGSGMGMPIHILNQRSDQEVYASIRKADTPFSQSILSYQTHWGGVFEEMYRTVIQAAIDAGNLPEKTTIKRYVKEGLTDKITDLVRSGLSSKKIVEAFGDDETMMEDIEIRTVDIPISIEFPDMVKEDPKNQAEVLKIHNELGIVSKATLSAKAGYNWGEEVMKMENETPGEGELPDEPEDDPNKPEYPDDPQPPAPPEGNSQGQKLADEEEASVHGG